LIRDAWTIDRFDVEIASAFVVSAWTWQGGGRQARARGQSPEALEAQLEETRLHFDLSTTWMKIGLLPESAVPVLRRWLERHRLAGVVLDPALRASDGGDMGARAPSLATLFDLCSLITPNADECEALSWTPDDVSLPSAAILFKGWRADEAMARDRLVCDGRVIDFERARVEGPDPRGTGCALATAIALRCASGFSVAQGCEAAIDWLDDARRHTGPGPDGRAHLR
jgi:hydroxymethylpyrimidine/phosphomethylpyrimidine kinase